MGRVWATLCERPQRVRRGATGCILGVHIPVRPQLKRRSVMAKGVLGFGSSHGPTIRSQPEDWHKLAERDKKDPRYDYAELLRNADPALEQEITLEKKQQRHVAAHAAIDKLNRVVQDAAPDVVVVISNQHSV